MYNCNFCNKELKNLNALKQHEIRCRENPNRKDYNKLTKYILEHRKGKTKDNCKDIEKQVNTTKDKYQNGYISPNKGCKHNFEYLYKEHNDSEIEKWLDYVQKKANLPEYKVILRSKLISSYKAIDIVQTTANINCNFLFEHDFIANLFLDNTLSDKNTVHHINKNTQDNNIKNLLVFETNNDHKKFHNSKYSWLIYNNDSHKFVCEIRKN